MSGLSTRQQGALARKHRLEQRRLEEQRQIEARRFSNHSSFKNLLVMPKRA